MVSRPKGDCTTVRTQGDHRRANRVRRDNGKSSFLRWCRAHAELQTRFAFSSNGEWSHDDGPFNYRAFYEQMLVLLVPEEGAPEDPWLTGVLAHYNQ